MLEWALGLIKVVPKFVILHMKDMIEHEDAISVYFIYKSHLNNNNMEDVDEE